MLSIFLLCCYFMFYLYSSNVSILKCNKQYVHVFQLSAVILFHPLFKSLELTFFFSNKKNQEGRGDKFLMLLLNMFCSSFKNKISAVFWYYQSKYIKNVPSLTKFDVKRLWYRKSNILGLGATNTEKKKRRNIELVMLYDFWWCEM